MLTTASTPIVEREWLRPDFLTMSMAEQSEITTRLHQAPKGTTRVIVAVVVHAPCKEDPHGWSIVSVDEAAKRPRLFRTYDVKSKELLTHEQLSVHMMDNEEGYCHFMRYGAFLDQIFKKWLVILNVFEAEPFVRSAVKGALMRLFGGAGKRTIFEYHCVVDFALTNEMKQQPLQQHQLFRIAESADRHRKTVVVPRLSLGATRETTSARRHSVSESATEQSSSTSTVSSFSASTDEEDKIGPIVITNAVRAAAAPLAKKPLSVATGSGSGTPAFIPVSFSSGGGGGNSSPASRSKSGTVVHPQQHTRWLSSTTSSASLETSIKSTKSEGGKTKKKK